MDDDLLIYSWSIPELIVLTALSFQAMLCSGPTQQLTNTFNSSEQSYILQLKWSFGLCLVASEVSLSTQFIVSIPIACREYTNKTSNEHHLMENYIQKNIYWHITTFEKTIASVSLIKIRHFRNQGAAITLFTEPDFYIGHSEKVMEGPLHKVMACCNVIAKKQSTAKANKKF